MGMAWPSTSPEMPPFARRDAQADWRRHRGQADLDAPRFQDKPTEQSLLHRAAAKLNAGNLKQAKNLLTSGGKAPETQATTDALRKLIAVQTDIPERCATAAAAAEASDKAPAAKLPTPLIKRLVRDLVHGAEPGPSGWRNSDISFLCRQNWGPQTLQRWTLMWHAAKVTPATRRLWGAATIIPL